MSEKLEPCNCAAEQLATGEHHEYCLRRTPSPDTKDVEGLVERGRRAVAAARAGYSELTDGNDIDLFSAALDRILALTDAVGKMRGALSGLVKAVNTNELAAAMACHDVVSFANVEDALNPALAALKLSDGVLKP